MTAIHSWVSRERLFPQWADKLPRAEEGALRAVTALLNAHERVEFSVDEHGLRVNGLPIDPVRVGEIVWTFTSLLTDRLICRLTLHAGLSRRELTSIVEELAAPLDVLKTPADHWARVLKDHGVSHVGIAQRNYLGHANGETGVLQRGRLVGNRDLDSDETAALLSTLDAVQTAASALRNTPPDAPEVEAAVHTAVDALLALLKRVRVVTLHVDGIVLNANGHPLRQDAHPHAIRFFTDELSGKGFTALTLKDGMTPVEARALISILSLRSDDPDAAGMLQWILLSSDVRRFVLVSAMSPRSLEAGSGSENAVELQATSAVQLEQRARELLVAAPDDFTSVQTESLLPRAIQTLTAETPLRLVERLAGLMNDPAGTIRHRALFLARRALHELKDEALKLFLAGTQDAVAARTATEGDPALQPMLAEVLQLWLSVAILSKEVSRAAGVIRSGVEPALAAAATSPEFQASLRAKLRLVGQRAGAAAFQMLARGIGDVRGDALLVLTHIGEPMLSTLRQLHQESNNPLMRRASADVIKAIESRQ